jgi:histone H1/5
MATKKKVSKPEPKLGARGGKVKNGVLCPKEDTDAGKIWAKCDALSKLATGGSKTKKPALRADILQFAVTKGISENTASHQHGRWRKFHGFSKPKAPSKAKPKAKAAKKPQTPAKKPAPVKAAAPKKAAPKRNPAANLQANKPTPKPKAKAPAKPAPAKSVSQVTEAPAPAAEPLAA